MKRYSTLEKYIAFVCSCAFIFILTGGQVEAARRSRVLSIALFTSGMGLQFGSSILKASAQDRYDTYLNAAIQADIQTHKDAFRVRRDAGTLMSRVGLGCVGLAVLFAIYSQLDTPEELVEDSVSLMPSSKIQARIPSTRLSSFAKHLSQNTSPLLPRSTFELHPHYDFQTHQASLRFLHHF